jgi:diguanylate cyclase (GGDEF)-like protein
MHLDVQTLSVATVFVMALLGVLLVFAGTQNRMARAPILWGAAYIGGAAAVGLVTARGAVPDWLSINFANALALVSIGLIWLGVRIFDGRPVRLAPIVALAALWLVACAVPAFRDNINLRVMLMAVLSALPAVDAARDVWRGRAEPLMSRLPTALILIAYAAISLARIPVTIVAPLADGHSLLSGAWLALLTFGNLLFTVVLAFLLLNMIKERSELKHKIASMIDPLSGVANRRAFLQGAKQLWEQQSFDFEPLAVLVFDLDHFKDINDRFGHSTGDTVLQIFAASASRVLGETAVFGRIGGEEFAAVLPVDDVDEAVLVADLVRRSFAAEAAAYSRGDLHPSVSVGVVTACDPYRPMRDFLAAADRALYRAKALGRNRVEAAEAMAPPTLSRDGAAPGRRQCRPREVAGV